MDSVSSYGKNQLIDRWDSVIPPMRVEYTVWSPKGAVVGSILPACTGAGRFDGSAIIFSGSYGGKLSKILPASDSKFHVLSFNLLLRSWETSPEYQIDPTNPRVGILATLVPGNGPKGRTTMTMTLSDGGAISIYLGGFKNSIGGFHVTGMAGIQIDKWVQIDVELFIDPDVGFCRVYQDGELMNEALLVDTQTPLFDLNNPVGLMTLEQPGNFQGRFDGIYLQDGSGNQNTSYMGRVHIVHDLARGFTGDTDFVDAGGVSEGHPSIHLTTTELRVEDDERIGNRSCRMVPDNEVGVFQGDKKVMNADTSGQRLVINGPADVGTKAIQISINARKTSADVTQYKFIAVADGLDFEQELESVNNTYEIRTSIYNEDPRDGTAWDQTKLLDFDWGIKKV